MSQSYIATAIAIVAPPPFGCAIGSSLPSTNKMSELPELECPTAFALLKYRFTQQFVIHMLRDKDALFDKK